MDTKDAALNNAIFVPKISRRRRFGQGGKKIFHRRLPEICPVEQYISHYMAYFPPRCPEAADGPGHSFTSIYGGYLGIDTLRHPYKWSEEYESELAHILHKLVSKGERS
jgi:hypothetical protein